MFQNEKIQFSKCGLRKLQQVKNKLFTQFESHHETLCFDTICFWIAYSSFDLNCGTKFVIFAQ